MKCAGFVVIHIDVGGDVVRDYNRWYDLDHGPEAVQLPGVISTRRYHAPPELRAERAVKAPAGEQREFLTLYWLAEGDLVQTRQGMFAHLGPGSAVANAGRLFRRDKVSLRSSTVARHLSTQKNETLDLDEKAVPYIGHLGVYVEHWSGQASHQDWLTRQHLPALANMTGLLGAVQLESLEEGGRGHNLVMAFLGDEPKTLAPTLRAHASRQSPPPGLSMTFCGCFNLITPLRYDFLRA